MCIHQGLDQDQGCDLRIAPLDPTHGIDTQILAHIQGKMSGDHFRCESKVPLVLLVQSASKFGLQLARIKEWALHVNPVARYGQVRKNVIFR